MDAWIRYYPIDVFPALWQKIEALVNQGQIIAPDEVYREIERKDDELFRWAKTRKTMFKPLDEATQVTVKEILGKFPRLVDTRKDRSRADPFVIALAKTSGSILVTGEHGGTPEKPKIPTVCHALNIRPMNILQLIRSQGWAF